MTDSEDAYCDSDEGADFANFDVSCLLGLFVNARRDGAFCSLALPYEVVALAKCAF